MENQPLNEMAEPDIKNMLNQVNQLTKTLNESEACISSMRERIEKLENEVKKLNIWRYSDWR